MSKSNWMPRTHLFVDPKVQGALVIRATLHWFICLLAMSMFFLCWRVMAEPSQPFSTHWKEVWIYLGPACVLSLILLPLVIVDILRFSNHFVGPLMRLRRSMRRLARGEHVDPIKFRGSDFWQDFADEFNAMLARIQNSSSTSEQSHEDVKIES